MDVNEPDLAQLWRLVLDLTEQLAQNRAVTASLQAQAGSVNSAASHQGTGFPLRRFNTHLNQDVYEVELEKMNSSFTQHNTDLQNENKQLAILLKEYEQTLESVMGKFRVHAHATQQHELSLARHYESLLLSRETSTLASDLSLSTAYSCTLAKMSRLLRSAFRTAAGELPESETHSGEVEVGGYVENMGMQDWALERECELARLESENQELRRMLGLLPPLSPPPLPPRTRLTSHQAHQAHQADHHDASPSAMPLRWETLDHDQNQNQNQSQRLVPSHPLALESDPSDGPILRRHHSPQVTSPPQSTSDIPTQSVQGQNRSHSPPPFTSETPLVTRKYGRRGVNGPNGIFGTGSFVPAGAGVESSSASAIGSTFRTPWLLDHERNVNANALGSSHSQTVNMTAENRAPSSAWDGLSNIYSSRPWAQFS